MNRSMKNSSLGYSLLFTNAIGNTVAGVLPPVIAVLVTNTLSLQALASLLIASAFVRFVLTPVLAPFVERQNPIELSLHCEYLHFGLCSWTVWQLFTNRISMGDWLLYFIGSAVIQSALAPAYSKISIRLVPNEEMTVFSAWEGAVFYIARLGGPIIAGLCLLLWPANTVLIAALWLPTIFALFVYAVLHRKTRHLFDGATCATRGQRLMTQTLFSMWAKDISEGFLIRWRIPTERFLTVQVFFELLVIIPSFGIVLASILISQNLDASWLGWMEAGCGAGLVLGSLAAPKVIDLLSPWRACIGSAFLLSVFVFLCGVFQTQENIYALTVALFLANFFLGIRMQSGAAQRRVAIPDAMRARFASIHIALNSAAAQLGIGSAALWLVYASPGWWFTMSGTVLFVLAILLTRIPGYRALIDQEVASAQGYYERTYTAVYWAPF